MRLLQLSQLGRLEATTAKPGWSKCSWEGGWLVVVVVVVVVVAVVAAAGVVGGGGRSMRSNNM